MKTLFAISLFIVIISLNTMAQTTTIKGRVFDNDTKEPIPFANITVEKNDSVITGTASDFDGNYTVKGIKPGKYKLKASYVGYVVLIINDAVVHENKILFQDFHLKTSNVQLGEICVVNYKVPSVHCDASSTKVIRSARSYAMVQESIQKAQTKIPLSSVETKPTFSLTATEINDFSKWNLWQEIQKSNLAELCEAWKMKPESRYQVQVKSIENKAVIDAKVVLRDKSGNTWWTAKTDNTGKAEIWTQFFKTPKIKNPEIAIFYNDEEYFIENPKLFQKGINVIKIPASCNIPNQVDVAFAVDATGSMGDEIEFLKTELVDIIEQTKQKLPNLDINLGSVFYRCFGNSYTTRHTPLSSDISQTTKFIYAQSAGEGGDEAVEEALRIAMDSLKWRTNARARILFFVLDEQPLQNETVLQTIHKNIAKAAELGVRIVPVIASAESISHAASLEYIMRSIALATNGTNLFLTDDSGIGSEHAKPTTDKFKVSLLSDLIKKVIYEFSFVTPCNDSINEIAADTCYFSNKIIASKTGNVKTVEETKNSKEFLLDYSATTTETDEEIQTADTNKINSQVLQNKEARIDISYYPNPCKGMLNVKVDGKIDELFLTDISGKVLEKIKTKSKTFKIDLSEYSTGIYFLNFEKNGKPCSGKIILTH